MWKESVSRERAEITGFPAVARLLMRADVTIGAFLVILLLYKFEMMQPASRGPRLFFAVVQHDAAIFALILLLYAAGSAMARWDHRSGAARAAAAVLARLCAASCLFVLFLYAADVFAYHFFVTRLYIGDLVTFSLEPRAAVSLLRSGWLVISDRQPWKLAIGAVLVALLLRACYGFLAKPIRSPVGSRSLAVAAVLLAVLSVMPVPSYLYSFHDQALYENFIERNESFFAHTKFSDGFRAKILAVPPAVTCRPGRGSGST